MKFRALRTAVAIVGLAALTGCQDRDVDLTVSVTVPADISPISSGVLTLSLWSYDPLLADAPATLADEDSVRFSHSQGTVDTFRMRVKAHVPGGLRHYVTVRGFEFTTQCVKYVLWDGIEGLGTPTSVVMRPVSTPACTESAFR